MGIEWTPSAGRHGVPEHDVIHAILNAVGRDELEPGYDDERVFVYVGPPHKQALRLIEVITAHRSPDTVVVFHAMELTDKFRYLAGSDWNERT